MKHQTKNTPKTEDDYVRVTKDLRSKKMTRLKEEIKTKKENFDDKIAKSKKCAATGFFKRADDLKDEGKALKKEIQEKLADLERYQKADAKAGKQQLKFNLST